MSCHRPPPPGHLYRRGRPTTARRRLPHDRRGARMMATAATTELSGLNSWPPALAEAAESLSCLGLPDVLPALHSAGLGISHSVLGGSHSVAVYPRIDSLEPVSSDQVLE